ncbi:hypothetical protein TKK_0003023 [Trichogramma kaykai]
MALSKVKIIFWNARSVASKFLELKKAAAEFDVIACVESWLTSEHNLNIPGFRTLRKDRTHSRGGGGGIVVWVRGCLAFEEIAFDVPNSVAELCGLRLTSCKPKVEIIICYRPPSYTTSSKDWEDIVRCVDARRPALLMGDFNAHNTSWNCEHSDNNGLLLEQACSTQGLILQNFDTTSFRNLRRNYRSNIDLIFTTAEIDQRTSTEACDDSWGSDHHPIFITITTENHCHLQRSHRINSTRTRWDGVLARLEEEYRCFFTEEFVSASPDAKFNFFFDIVASAIQAFTPKKRQVAKCRHNNPVPWWDAECDRAKRVRQAAFKKYNCSLELQDFIAYKKRCAELRRMLRRKKRNSFIEFAESLNFRTSPAYVWKKCKIFKNKCINVDKSKQYSNTKRLLLRQRAVEKLCPLWVETDPASLPTCEPNEFLEDRFSFTEFNTALEEKKDGSAPGLDGTGFDVIKQLPIKYRLVLLDIFNEMFEKMIFPATWQNVFIFFIEKPGGSGLRPVSLTSCYSKLFETMLKNRLQWWAEVNDWIPPNQHGFRRGHSCADNLAGLALMVEDAFLASRDVLTAFLDVEGAFDNVNIDVLLQRLALLGCSRRVVEFVKFSTRERSIYLEGESVPLRVFKGVPQGAVISPLLYSLYVASIAEDVPANIRVSQFADDVSVSVETDDPSVGFKRMKTEDRKEKKLENVKQAGLDIKIGF